MTATATYCHRDGAILIARGEATMSVPIDRAPALARGLAAFAQRGDRHRFIVTLSNPTGTVIVADSELLPLASAIDHAVAIPRMAAHMVCDLWG